MVVHWHCVALHRNAAGQFDCTTGLGWLGWDQAGSHVPCPFLSMLERSRDLLVMWGALLGPPHHCSTVPYLILQAELAFGT